MSNDINAVAIVSYIWTKGEDDGMKGTYEVPAQTLEDGGREFLAQARRDLIADGYLMNMDGQDEVLEYVTILSTKWGVPTNWIGAPAGL